MTISERFLRRLVLRPALIKYPAAEYWRLDINQNWESELRWRFEVFVNHQLKYVVDNIA